MQPPRRVSVAVLLGAVAAALLLIALVPSGREESAVTRIDEVYAEFRDEFPEVPDMEAGDLSELLRTGDVIVVDVRDEAERRVSAIPGAVTPEALEDRDSANQLPVVAYCTIGYRSGLYAAELRRRGVPAVNLKGGILAWCHEGGDVVTPAGEPTRRVHVYGRRWNLLPPEYESVW